VVSFEVRITDQDPAAAPINATFSLVVNPAVDKENVPVEFAGKAFYLEDATNVVRGGTIDPSAANSPPAPFSGRSDGIGRNDLPTALQRQAFQYQLHVNGGNRFGGTVQDQEDGFVPSDSEATDTFPGAITASDSSLFAGETGGTYTCTAKDDDEDGQLDLLVTSDCDPWLEDGTQVFSGAFSGTDRILHIGSVGVRILLHAVPAGRRIYPGDAWTIEVEGFTEPVTRYFLHPDWPEMPEGLRLDTDGLIEGSPARAGDYTFIVVAQQYDKDPEEEDSRLLNTALRQYFIRVAVAPISSKFVMDRVGFKVDFGEVNKDSLRFNLMIAKEQLKDFSQLKGATFDIIIGGNTENQVTLSEEVGSTLEFGGYGKIDYPPPLLVGEQTNKYQGKPWVLVEPLNPNLGLLKVFIERLTLAEAIGADMVGTAGEVEVPVTVMIDGVAVGTEQKSLRLDEIVVFTYRKGKARASGTIPPGPLAASQDIGQFFIGPASGDIVFDAATGCDTLQMRLQGYLRDWKRQPLIRKSIPASAKVYIHLGALCGFQGIFGQFFLKGNKLVMENGDATVPVKSLIIDEAKGTFRMEWRAPATNAARIQGENNGLVILPEKPFAVSVRIRILDEKVAGTTADDVLYFDAQYQLVLYREGNKIGLR
jgi:hypothetical protein